MCDVRGAVLISEVYVLFAQQSRGRRNLSMVGPPTKSVSFAFAVQFLRVKSVAIQHGLGNFSKEVFSHRINQENGLALTCRASAQFSTSIRQEINCRTKQVGAYCVSCVSKVSVGRVSARRHCGSMFRQFLKCCVLCARGDVLAVGARRTSQR